MIYNKYTEYYIKTYIKDQDKALLDNVLNQYIKHSNKKIIKISHVWHCLYINEKLRNDYSHLFKMIPIKLINDSVKTYHYPKKNLIKNLLEFGIDTDFETKELILNILYLSAKLVCDNNTISGNNDLLDEYIYKFTNCHLKNFSYTNKYNLFQDVILNFILIELFLANYKKINILEFIKYITEINCNNFSKFLENINRINI